MEPITHRKFSETNDDFKKACEKVNIPPSKRQALKYRRKRGRAYTGK